MSLATVAAEICQACGGVSLERRGFCAVCGSRGVAFSAVDGSAVVWSLTHVHRPPTTADADAGPYTVAVLALDAGPRLMARVQGDLAIGDRVGVSRPDIASSDTQVRRAVA